MNRQQLNFGGYLAPLFSCCIVGSAKLDPKLGSSLTIGRRAASLITKSSRIRVQHHRHQQRHAPANLSSDMLGKLGQERANFAVQFSARRCTVHSRQTWSADHACSLAFATREPTERQQRRRDHQHRDTADGDGFP